MAPQSRTGKLMQGLFGRFGKKNPAQPTVSPANPRSNSTPSQAEIEEREFPSANRFDDDEETNWDDAETLADENNPVVYAQPIEPIVAPPVSTPPDLEEWDEALPAATVKNSNIQEVRRSKKPIPAPQNADMWGDDLPKRTFSPSSAPTPTPATSTRIEQAIGLWMAMLQQFRRLLPAPIRQLSDAILTAIVVMLVTIGIWVVDGFFVPGTSPSIANPPAASVEVQPNATSAVAIVPEGSPEQAFIEAIQTQLSDITSQYPDDIIQTLKVDIAGDRLIVKLNPIWYLVSDDRQDRVTDRMWLQAKANHFTKLEIQNVRGDSIARSPVVGQHMIILQRRQSY
ncbi:hypothetical protein [Chamaesiphon sp. VAR_48_metabat_135_sub]|uniref:hypothetical protein n=1 Tax=Chamaesiphon sp. VAR_48_metabat_135_sub TaxID=2964699 RepID=UPI00286AEF48|nr:hypothetical protein [Chamaesiphon sp. VAR_48_metabat_135_sub]